MHASARILLTASLAALVLCCPVVAQEEPNFVLRGRVVDVHDGDTIKVALDSGPIKVRFHGIDAPELNQSYGGESRNALARLLRKEIVDLEPMGQESYDRMVAIVYVGDLNVNEEMIKSGHAWAARKYLRKRDHVEWCAYENAARRMRRGLWSQRPEEWIDPREWYHRKKRHYKYKDYQGETTEKCVGLKKDTNSAMNCRWCTGSDVYHARKPVIGDIGGLVFANPRARAYTPISSGELGDDASHR